MINDYAGNGPTMSLIKIAEYNRDIVKIGVVADTHIPSRSRYLPVRLFELFKDVQLIIHAGDLVDPAVLEELKVLAPVEAVAGNMDSGLMRKKLGRARLIRAGDVSIGLVHGDRAGRRFDPQQLSAVFLPRVPQVIVFGHLHEPLVEKLKGTLFLNPGSATDPRRGQQASCALLSIETGEVRGEIIYLD